MQIASHSREAAQAVSAPCAGRTGRFKEKTEMLENTLYQVRHRSTLRQELVHDLTHVLVTSSGCQPSHYSIGIHTKVNSPAGRFL